ncbi:phage late control D family protein [Agarilytica rhodophyticola]|uniref:phage late control D family protein n=1 Tax=Agarilytica rhodophyticola TaxID=1737490 RepID=UPI000B3476B4|nr:phage late control D family protein [Agarilytica rhodophyticola]
MSTALPIHQGQDFYVPQFEVKLRNQTLAQPIVRDVLKASYKDSIKDIDSFEITINNWDAETRDFKYADASLFDPGNELELLMGYYGSGEMRSMIKGQITSLRPNFPATGKPTLVISGLNLLHKFRNKQESHAYTELTDSQVAKQIAGRLGVSIRTDSAAQGNEETYKYLLQDNQYDIIYLMERAHRLGYDLFVEETSGQPRLYFGPSVNIQRTTYELEYGKSLIHFQPNLSTANQVAKVTVRGWDEQRKAKIEATVARSQIATKGVGQQGGQAQIDSSFADREEVIANKPVATNEEAQTLARETLERIAKDMIKGSGSTVGLPDLRAGSVLQLSGLGQRFSGRYFVTATTHTIGDTGYTTQFQCRREELS